MCFAQSRERDFWRGGHVNSKLISLLLGHRGCFIEARKFSIEKNDMYMIHHCLFFPNKYFPNWFWESNYNAYELDQILNNYIESLYDINILTIIIM